MSTLLLLSGGLDSLAVAAAFPPSAALFVDYGQRPAAGERRAARDIAAALKLELIELAVDLSAVGSGLVVGRSPAAHAAPTPEWVPFRNQFLITIAAAAAIRESLIVTGPKASAVLPAAFGSGYTLRVADLKGNDTDEIKIDLNDLTRARVFDAFRMMQGDNSQSATTEERIELAERLRELVNLIPTKTNEQADEVARGILRDLGERGL